MEELLQKIDRYIEESLDENFDRYLEQMKDTLVQHPEQMEDVARSVEENMERYRMNQARLREELEQRQEQEEVAVSEEADGVRPEEANAESEEEMEDAGTGEEADQIQDGMTPSQDMPHHENVPKQTDTGSQGNTVEFKIGIGVLSAIGVLFVLVGLVILICNFLPDVMQGMMMMCFFALVWILSQLCLSHFAQKLSLGCTAAGITGMYLAVVLNYYVFESFSEWMACGLFVLVGIIAWASGRISQSAVIQCTGAVGFLFFWLFLPWKNGISAYIVILAVMVLLNALWQLGASGKYTCLVRMTHQIAFLISALIFGVILTLKQIPGWIDISGGVERVFLYSAIIAVLINLFYLNQEDTGFFVVWLCGMIFNLVYLCGIWLVNMIIGNPWWNCVLLVPVAANIVFLFVEKFRWRYQPFYYQAAGVLLLVSVSEKVWWVGLMATVLLFLLGLWKIREHQLLQEMCMLAVLTLEILSIPTGYAFLVSLLLMVLAIIAIIAGFVRWEMPLRIYGLCLALFACGKVVLYDFWDLELLQKSLLFVGVGVIAIVIAVIYAVLEHRQKKNRDRNVDISAY